MIPYLLAGLVGFWVFKRGQETLAAKDGSVISAPAAVMAPDGGAGRAIAPVRGTAVEAGMWTDAHGEGDPEFVLRNPHLEFSSTISAVPGGLGGVGRGGVGGGGGGVHGGGHSLF